MSVNFENELSLVGGVRFALSAAVAQRAERSGFLSGPDHSGL